MKPKFFMTIILSAGFIFYVLISLQFHNSEGEPNSGHNDTIVSVAGWGYNTTRDTSQYILRNNNLSAHILPEHFCDYETFLLVMVCSGPSHVDARNAIRETWGQERNILGKNVSLLFLLGETANASLQYDVMMESERFGDIVQERFIDSYNNLTLKSVVMLKLVKTYCANSSKYLLKIDDDMFVNMDLIIAMLLERNTTTNLLMGKLICGAKPIKDANSKWYSPRYMYSARTYPNYLSGTGYLMSVDVAGRLYQTALKTPIFHLEDVYVTGICAKKARIKPRNNPRFTYQQLSHDVCLLTKLFTAHRFSPSEIRKSYMSLRDEQGYKRDCVSRDPFHVNHWFMTNILKLNKTRRKNKCD